MSLDKYISSTEGLSFTTKISVPGGLLLSVTFSSVTYVFCTVYITVYSTVFNAVYSTLLSTGYTIVLDTIYNGHKGGCSSVSKSDQPVTWTPRYSLFYSNVYSTAHRTVYTVH